MYVFPTSHTNANAEQSDSGKAPIALIGKSVDTMPCRRREPTTVGSALRNDLGLSLHVGQNLKASLLIQCQNVAIALIQTVAQVGL